MRVPIRRSEILNSTTKTSDDFLSSAALQRYKSELENLVKIKRPEAVKEVQRTAEMGDFSENAAYQMAKGRLRGINSRITSLEEKIKRAVIIKPGVAGKVSIGSIVTVEVGGRQKIFEILGSQESDPLRGKVSYLSPLGVLLIGAVEGDVVKVKTKGGEVEYKILAIE
ncbi:TPA: transcription elongation factor GreA [Candidatus Uhrbacteria bacterium]|nr:transcription elongation factor GreA [Candidatus Uhrbacteria bacterium]HCU32072.1 transcription elongation factor GreA [Candidatus Uhrbacteria bacterium]